MVSCVNSVIHRQERAMRASTATSIPWRAREIYIALTGGIRLRYRLAEADRRVNLLEERDERSRLALEAFSALPITQMTSALDTYLESLRGQPAAQRDQARMRDALGELVAFVRRFGPLGIGWGMTMQVTNPEADNLARRLEAAERRERDVEPAAAAHAPRSETRWVASFHGQAAGRWGMGQVRSVRTWESDDLAQRIELDDTILSDGLGRIAEEQADLNDALRLVEQIALADEPGEQPDGSQDPGAARLRAFIGTKGGWLIGLSIDDPDPLGTNWRRARLGGPARRGPFWNPLAAGEDVDWRLFARLILSNLIGRQLNYVLPYLDVNDEGRFLLDLRPSSTLEVIYLQLLEHVRQRLAFGVGTCHYCGGAILRTRHRDSPTGNQWHRGRCSSAGRARRLREEEASRGAPQPE
jgi:hypothetical protein